jgi:aryl-alcohol dehydrogenase-like predicted oxidoreductase
MAVVWCGPSVTAQLALGTAQFGLPYGLGLASTGLPDNEVVSILDGALSAGVSHLDTARAYGDAEDRIGRWLVSRPQVDRSTLHITSKIEPLGNDLEAAVRVEESHNASCRALGVTAVDTLLVHRIDDLFRPGVVRVLGRMIDEGTIRRIGASVYSIEDARRAMQLKECAALQVPFSLANRELLDSGLLEHALSKGVRIQVRSVFLQGLLLMHPHRIPKHLQEAAPVIDRLRQLAASHKLSMIDIALAPAIGQQGVSEVVIGADSSTQLAEICSAAQKVVDQEIVKAAVTIARALPADISHTDRWKRR